MTDWELVGKIPNAVTAKFMDLGPYLAGDRVKKSPNLAAIPSDSWRMGIFGGAGTDLPHDHHSCVATAITAQGRGPSAPAVERF